MFHRHKWTEVSRTFTPSPSNIKKMTGGTEETFLFVTFGFSTILLRCERCGDLTSREFTGKIES